jgi:hypothetical protein
MKTATHESDGRPVVHHQPSTCAGST